MEVLQGKLADITVEEARRSAKSLRDRESFVDGEIVIGLVGAVGTDLKHVSEIIRDRLRHYKYSSKIISVSEDIITPLGNVNHFDPNDEYARIVSFMDAGDYWRRLQDDTLALSIAEYIFTHREHDRHSVKPKHRFASIIRSLKHPEEVNKFREIYKNGFYLIGVFCDENERIRSLENKGVSNENAKELVQRDEHQGKHGQQTRDTFQLSDFFISYQSGNINIVENSIKRIFDLIFGHPYLTPTFEEYAMYMAYVNSLRSADLSRQVGAVLTKNQEIIASGTNDCPKAGGGLYWPVINEDGSVTDSPGGRDYMVGCDSNKKQLHLIIKDVLKLLEKEETRENIDLLFNVSLLSDLTEYGRIVHAEMESILMCARNSISTSGSHLYCTTFPCHNCAKHIIAAGITKVYFIEPYPKSKTPEFYQDCIYISQNTEPGNKVQFLHFIGIGPRRFYDLFSMKPSDGHVIIRKNKMTGDAIRWDSQKAHLRQQMFPYSYLEGEADATKRLGELLYNEREEKQNGTGGSGSTIEGRAAE